MIRKRFEVFSPLTEFVNGLFLFLFPPSVGVAARGGQLFPGMPRFSEFFRRIWRFASGGKLV